MKRKIRLLIIDDELEMPPASGGSPRRDQYQLLGDQFDLLLLQSPKDLHSILDAREVDAALVDFVLDEWRTDAYAIIKAIDGRIPVALISNDWSTNFSELSSVIADFPIARLFTWDDMATPQGRDIIDFWIDASVRARFGSSALQLGPNDPLRLVQFSDLQFNAKLPERFAVDTQVTLQTIHSTWSDPPIFLALTGDIAEAGRPIEYEMALEWLEALKHNLKRDQANIEVLTIPGNHDVSWPLALSTRVDPVAKLVTEGDALFPDLECYAFAPYREFARRAEGGKRWEGSAAYWISGSYRRDGLILFGLNSSEDLNSWGVPSRKLQDETVATLFAEIAKLKEDSPDALVVGLIHHPLEQGDDGIINSGTFKKSITENIGSIVLLTGHVHEGSDQLTSGSNRPGILQIASSTFTLASQKRPEDSLRGFNMVEFGRQNRVVHSIKVASYSITSHQIKVTANTCYRRDTNGRISEA